MQNLCWENEFYLHENKNHFHIMVSHLKVEAISEWSYLLQSEILNSFVLVQMNSALNGCSICSCAGVKQRFFEGDVFPRRVYLPFPF